MQYICCRAPEGGHDVPENTGHVKHQPQGDIQHVGQILDKYAVVHEKASEAEGKDHQGQKNGEGIHDPPGNRNAPHRKHTDDDAHGNQHFEAVDAHFTRSSTYFGR